MNDALCLQRGWGCHRLAFLLMLAASMLTLPSCEKESEALSPDDTLMLTWHGDPTRTIVVQWLDGKKRTKLPAVSISPPDREDWQTVGQCEQVEFAAGLWVTRVSIEGLEPGQEYSLRVNDIPPTYRFRTMPGKLGDEPIVFISGGDVGTSQHAEGTMQQAAAVEPRFVLIGGDIAYADSGHPDRWKAFLEDYRRLMITPRGRLIPMIVCIGDHEIDGEKGVRSRAYASCFYSLFGLFAERGYKVLDFGDYMSIVLLDSGLTTPIEGEQTNWLRETLNARAQVPDLFITYHIAAYPSYFSFDDPASTAIRTNWCPLFDRFGVETVFECNNHAYKRTVLLRDGKQDPRGVLYLGDGAWGELRQPKTPAERPYLAKSAGAYHFIKTDLYRDHHTHTAIGPDGDVIDQWSSTDPENRAAVVPDPKPQS